MKKRKRLSMAEAMLSLREHRATQRRDSKRLIFLAKWLTARGQRSLTVSHKPTLFLLRDDRLGRRMMGSDLRAVIDTLKDHPFAEATE